MVDKGNARVDAERDTSIVFCCYVRGWDNRRDDTWARVSD